MLIVRLPWLSSVSNDNSIYVLATLILSLIGISSCWPDWHINDGHGIPIQKQYLDKMNDLHE